MVQKNLPQKIVAYAVAVVIMILFIIWFIFGHMDVPVEKTRFVSGFASCAVPDPNNPTNAYGATGDLVFDKFSPTRLVFAAFGAAIIVFLSIPLIGQDSRALNDIAIIIVVISFFMKAVIVIYMLFVWTPTYNRVGSGFVNNFFNDLRACCVTAIASSVDNRCPNGLPNYPTPVACVAPLNTLVLDDLVLNELAILFIIIIILLIIGDIILGIAAFLSKETTLASNLQDIVNKQFNVGKRINKGY